MIQQTFHSQQVVSGKSAGQSTVTEDGGMARNYPKLTEVLTKTGHITDAYYFVDPNKAKNFVSKLTH